MHSVFPSVYLIGETAISTFHLNSYLETIGAEGWETDADTDIEEIVEVMGRGCYNSFLPGINPNVTQVRDGKERYLANIIKSGHGSVLEHAWASFMFDNVSRVFTHELVRHRVGVAISQESLRYVRATDLGFYIPQCFSDNAKASEVFTRAIAQAEELYAALLSEDVLGEDINTMPFTRKKELTSAARRVLPIGMATRMGWSCNMRALRHLIELRTAKEAEEEIRLVFSEIAKIAKFRWPHLFGDFEETEDGWVTPYSKI